MKRNNFSHAQDLKSNLSNGQTVKTTKILGVSTGPTGDTRTHFGGWAKSQQLGTSNPETLIGLGSKHSVLCSTIQEPEPASLWEDITLKIKWRDERFPIGPLFSVNEDLVPWKGGDLFLNAKHSPQTKENPRKDFRPRGGNFGRMRP